MRGPTWNASAQPAAPSRAKAASRLHVIPCCTARLQSKALPRRFSTCTACKSQAQGHGRLDRAAGKPSPIWQTDPVWRAYLYAA